MSQTSSSQPTDARARLAAHFAGDTVEHPNRWSQLWDKGDFLPWDRGAPNPALIDLLSGREGNTIIDAMVNHETSGLRRRKRVLVPGCGRGYDVLLFASFGFDAYGLEISERAVEKCRQEQERNGHKYPITHSEGAGKTEFLVGDFFRDTWIHEIGIDAVDVIYDYTFLSALHPSMRPAWSSKMKQLLDPNGLIICIEFPTYKDPSTGGPPFSLPPEVYYEHLSHPGKDVPYDEYGHLKTGSVEDEGPAALARIVHYQPTRTHEIGKGTDWVSIWRHLCKPDQ